MGLIKFAEYRRLNMKYLNVLFIRIVFFTVMLLISMVGWTQTTRRAFELFGPNGPNVSLNAVALAVAIAETKYMIETDGARYSQNPELSQKDFDMFFQLALEIQADLDDGAPINVILNAAHQSLPRSNGGWGDWRDSLPMFFNDKVRMFRDRWDSTGQRKR